MRFSSAAPSSNSWLPTAFRSSPIWFIASIVGSSWKSADSSGDAPIRSPADTTSVLRFSAAFVRMWVARYSAPPAGTRGELGSGAIVPGVVDSRWPWKSLRPSSWTSTSLAAWPRPARAAAGGDEASRSRRIERMPGAFPESARSASPARERARVFSIAVSSSRDLFANFERMRREIDELFGDVFERQTGLRGRGFSPSVDVFYVDDPPRAVVKADLAGVDISDVALEIRGRQLLIAGERRPAAGGRPPVPADRDRARAVPAAGRARASRWWPTRPAPRTRTASSRSRSRWPGPTRRCAACASRP